MFPLRVKYDGVAKKEVGSTYYITVYQLVEKSRRRSVCEGIKLENARK